MRFSLDIFPAFLKFEFIYIYIYILGRVENQKSLIFLKSQAGFHGAHKNEVIHQVLKTKNIHFHIGKCHFMGLILRSLNISRIMTVQ